MFDWVVNGPVETMKSFQDEAKVEQIFLNNVSLLLLLYKQNNKEALLWLYNNYLYCVYTDGDIKIIRSNFGIIFKSYL